MEAAGLASSIITFLDLTVKVIARAREYLGKASSAPEHLRSIDTQLPLLAKCLENIKKQALSRRLAPDVSVELLKIVNSASEELKRLHHYVTLLTADPRSSKLRRFNLAVRGVLDYDTKIESTLEKIREYTDTLNFFQTSVATGRTDDILRYLRLLQDGQFDLKLQYERDSIRKWLDGKPRDERVDACIAKRAPDTCDWIFQTPAYSSWLSSDASITDAHILWLHGPPGFGKTFLAASIFDRIEHNEDAAAVFWTSEGRFANATLVDIPRSWIAQLLTKDLSYCEYVHRVWSSSKADTASATEVWNALKQLLTASPKVVTLVIDGLDEYQQQKARRDEQAALSHQQSIQHIDIREFLSTLKTTLKGIPCRVLCVSQPDGEIRSELEASQLAINGFKYSFEYSITQSDMRKDLDSFAKHVINGKLPKKSDQLRSDLSALVASKAEGQMLWIALQERDTGSLRPSFSEKKLRQVIESTPRGLDQLYSVNLDRISRLDVNDQKRAWRILNWVMNSLRPLTVHEIVEAILIEDSEDLEEFPEDDLPDDPNEEDVHGELRSLCGNFIAFEYNGKENQPRYWQVRLAHSSVRAFLAKHLNAKAGHDFATASTQNALLGRLCIRYLIYENVWLKNVILQDPPCVALDSHPFLTYAATFFILHVSPENRQEMETLLKSFLLVHYDNYKNWQVSARAVADPASLGLAPDKELWQWKSNLTFAAALGLTDAVRSLCDAEDVKDLNSIFPLHAASWSGSVPTAQLLLDRGLRVNQPMDGDTMPLHIAATRGNNDIVELLLDNGAHINAFSNKGTAVHQAALFGYESVVETLLQHNADITMVDHDGCLPLHNAVLKRHKSIVMALLRFESRDSSTVNQVTDRGWSPLLLAVENGDQDLVEILLKHGGNPIQLGDDGMTPLSMAAGKGQEAVFELLLGKCENVSTAINMFSHYDGFSLLHIAVRGKNLNIVKKLVQEGADPARMDYWSKTPLHQAIWNGVDDIVDYLFDKQGELDPELYKWRPVHYACDTGRTELVQLLISKGADLKICTHYGCTPLEIAARKGHRDVVELILKYQDGKETLNMRCSNGDTPIMAASAGAHLQTMDILLTSGADASLISESGLGPLYYAANSGSVAAVKAILGKQGPNLADKFTLFGAVESGKKEVFDLLSKHFTVNNLAWTGGITIMHCAARGGNTEIIKQVLDRGDPRELLLTRTNRDRAALSFAVRQKNLEAAKVILERLAELKPPVPFDSNAVFHAIYEGRVESVKLLYDTDKNAFMKATLGGDKWTPLQEACHDGHAEVMDFLIEKGFNVLDLNGWNSSCLHMFAETGHDSVARFFRNIDWDAGLRVASTSGYTPLLRAAAYGQSRVFRRYLRYGASMLDRVENQWKLTAFMTKGDSCLHLSAYFADTEIATSIIETIGKSCLEWRNDRGLYTVHDAAVRGRSLFLEYLWDKGAKFDVTTYENESPLLFTVMTDNRLAASFLLSKGLASFEKTLDSPIIPYAALLNSHYMLKSLLDHGFELKSGQEDGQTLLHMAASIGSQKTVDFLLSRGFDWNTKDHHGWSPRDCLNAATLDAGSTLQAEKTKGPKTWLRPTSWAFSKSETSWFTMHGTGTTAKIRDVHKSSGAGERPPIRALTADHYLLPTPSQSYFEVTVVECPSSNAIAIGLLDFIGEFTTFPYRGIAYTGETGWFFRSSYRSDPYGFPFGPGDTIGCGVDYKAGNLFFTKNGKCLGCALNDVYGRGAPALISMERSLVVSANFGPDGFVFDIAKHGYDNEKCKRCYEGGSLKVRCTESPGSEEEWKKNY